MLPYFLEEQTESWRGGIAGRGPCSSGAVELEVEVGLPLHTLALAPVSYTHLTLPTTRLRCRSRWSPYH